MISDSTLTPSAAITGGDTSNAAQADVGSAKTAKRSHAWFQLALIAVGACLCVCGGWWWFHSEAGNAPSDAGPLIAVVTDAPPGVSRGGRGGGRGRTMGAAGNNPNFFNRVLNRVTAPAPSGIEITTNGYVVRGTGVYMDVVPARGSEHWQYRFFYSNQSLVTPDQQKVIRAMLRTNDADAATKAGVTADQKQKLKTIPPGGMIVQAFQRTQIASLFTAWLAAAGRSGASPAALATTAPNTAPFPAAAKPAQDALITALSSIAQQQVQPSLQNAADRVKQIHDILGDSVIDKLQ